MSRAITIGNGKMLVGIDQFGQVRDFYYSHVGHSNHINGASSQYTHRVGVWVEGKLRWLSDPSWHTVITSSAHGATGKISSTNDELSISLTIEDVVHNERNIFLRKIELTNHAEMSRDIRLFFGQEFRISETRRGDTAFYDPRVASVVHYKGHKAFLIHATLNNRPFDDYTVGLFDIEGRAGSYADAEDGALSRNPIEHGSVDSVLGLHATLEQNGKATAYYWITVGDFIKDAHALHHSVLEETPEGILASTESYWQAWTEKEGTDLSPLDNDLQYLYHRSLAVIRVHADNGGGIIASSDSDILNQGRDTYSYVWPRDAAIAAHALDRAHYFDTTERFYRFMANVMEKDGYLMHKYRADGALGSSWHPWMRNGKVELPIQEDETATVLFMLGKHYDLAKDLEFIESLYNPFIEPAADFLTGYIDLEVELPIGSYDLWEEKFGASTYTAASVYGGLESAALISAFLGKRKNAEKYRAGADRIKRGIMTHLFDRETSTFIKLIRHENGSIERDMTVDTSSFHGLIRFGVLRHSDQIMTQAFRGMTERLKVPTAFGGYMRYEGDNYYRSSNDAPPNAWIVTTLWAAQYLIGIAKTRQDLKEPYGILRWVFDRATQSGILPEQIHPYTGTHLSTAPLVWSHAEFVITVHEYLDRYRTLK